MFKELAEGCCCIFQPGDTIVAQDEYVANVYYLEKGSCYRMLTTEKGDEVIYDIKEGGKGIPSTISALSIFADHYSTYSFVAKTPCQCYRIPSERFKAWAESRPEILLELLQMSVDLYRHLVVNFQCRQEGRVANRLCQLLLNRSKLTNGQLLVSKFYTNAEMGAFLGIHKVTVSRIIRSLRDEGVIAKSKDGIVIVDQKRLTEYAQGAKLLYK